jgi:hypothetical protein
MDCNSVSIVLIRVKDNIIYTAYAIGCVAILYSILYLRRFQNCRNSTSVI